VTSGQTLSGLAARYGVTVAQLMAWNNIAKPRGLRIGETLNVAAPTPAKPRSHTVAAGETMSGIARRYGIPMTDLARWNGMSEPRPLRIGERLRLAPPSRSVTS
jgi:LysM repeat protein